MDELDEGQRSLAWQCLREGCTCRDPRLWIANHFSGPPHKPGCGCPYCRRVDVMIDQTLATARVARDGRSEMATDIAEFRALLDRFYIDYHIERHEGPRGCPIDGAAVSIELGVVEIAFANDGAFLGWIEYEDGSSIIHPAFMVRGVVNDVGAQRVE